MPITTDITEHDLFGPIIRSARVEGERTLLRNMIGQRYGAIPAWAVQRLESMAAPDLERLGLRLLDSPSLEDLFA